MYKTKEKEVFTENQCPLSLVNFIISLETEQKTFSLFIIIIFFGNEWVGDMTFLNLKQFLHLQYHPQPHLNLHYYGSWTVMAEEGVSCWSLGKGGGGQRGGEGVWGGRRGDVGGAGGGGGSRGEGPRDLTEGGIFMRSLLLATPCSCAPPGRASPSPAGGPAWRSCKPVGSPRSAPSCCAASLRPCG